MSKVTLVITEVVEIKHNVTVTLPEGVSERELNIVLDKIQERAIPADIAIDEIEELLPGATARTEGFPEEPTPVELNIEVE